jgi:hypothetical protein
MNAYNCSTSTFEKSGAKSTFPKGGSKQPLKKVEPKSEATESSEGAKVSETNIFIYYDFI